MTQTRGFAITKEDADRLRSHGLPEKVIYQAGRGAESLEECLASFRGRVGKLVIARDLRAFGPSRRAVADTMAKLEKARIRVVDILHPGDTTVAEMVRRADVAIGGSRFRDRRAGEKCHVLYEEKIGATNAKRPKFNLMMKYLERGDTLVVYSCSRLARDLPTLHKLVKHFEDEGVTLRRLTEPHLNTKTATGRLMFNIQGAFDQFERDKIQERTLDGMAELKRRGVKLGRTKMFDKKQTAEIKRDRKSMTREQVAAKWKCSPGTIDKYAA